MQTVSAQTADQHIGTLINESNWFELKRTMDETPRDSVSPLLYQMGTALTAHYFNRPDSACTAIGILLNEYQPELGPQNAVNMATLLATDLTRSNRYREASALMQSLAGQLQAQGVAERTLPNCRYTHGRCRSRQHRGRQQATDFPHAAHHLPHRTGTGDA